MKRIFREGYEYKKAGVALMDIVPAGESQQNLFLKLDKARHDSLMRAMDKINAVWGRETLRPGASGYDRPWRMKRSMLSHRFTTRWEELLRVGD